MGRILIAALAVALLVLVGFFAFRALRPPAEGAATAKSAPDLPASGAAAAPTPAPRPLAAAVAADAGSASAQDPASAPATKARKSEAAMMDDLRATLGKGTPQATLDLARELERTYPEGAQAEERSLYAIDALIALNRISEMRDEARKHLTKWRDTEIAVRVMARTGVHPEPLPPPGYR